MNRCWYCGNRISKGRFCQPSHEFVFSMMGLDLEMLENGDAAPMRWTSKDSSLQLERQYDLRNITAEIEKAKAKVEKEFKEKIKIISGLIEHETKLSGIYLHQCLTKQRIGTKYKENVVLNNTIGNQPYRSISTLLLIRSSFYGSARPILRQFFESLIITKYAEHNSDLGKRWHAQNESNSSSEQVSLSRDVLIPLLKRGKEVGALRETWRSLCAMSHATRQSQQVLRVPNPDEKGQFEEYLGVANFDANTEFSLDLLFLMLAMNSRLIKDHLAKKANRWWFGELEDAYGSYRRERTLRRRITHLINEYFVRSKNQPYASKMLRNNILEYSKSWA